MRRFLSVILAARMILSLAVPAFADTPTIEGIEVDGGVITAGGDQIGVSISDDGTVVVDANIESTGDGVTASNNSDVIVNGNVTGGAKGVVASGDSIVYVGGDVTTDGATAIDAENSIVMANNVISNDAGINASGTGEGGETVVSVADVTVTEAGKYTDALYAGSSQGGSAVIDAENVSISGDKTLGAVASVINGDSTATINAGSVTAEGAEAKAVTVAARSGTATVNVDSASASGEGSIGVHIYNEGGTGNANVAGDVKADGTAVKVEMENGGAASVTVGGDAYSGGTAVDVHITGGTAAVTVDGDVASGDTAVDATADGADSVVTVDVGSVAVEADGPYVDGVYAGATNGGTATVSAESVTITGDKSLGAVAAVLDGGGSATVNTGSVTAEGTEAKGISVIAESGEATVNADSVSASGENSIGVNVHTEGGTANANVEGDVEAGGTGIMINGESGTANVTINGTLSVTDGTPILLSDTVAETNAGNINITVWKIEGAAEDGSVVSGGADAEAAAAVQENINYIIRIAPDESSQSVFGGNYKDGDTLHSGEQQIKVTVPDGFTVKAYATDGTAVEITLGEDGNYYATVPTSGGIYLHATLEEIPAPSPRSNPGVKVTFDPDGGTLNGETDILVKWFYTGQKIRLPEAPEKEGFTFAGWETEINDEKVIFQPGDEFTVTGVQDFVALWTAA